MRQTSEIHMIYYFHTRGINWLQNTNILTEQYIALAFEGTVSVLRGLPWWLNSKESSCNTGATGDTGLITGSGWSPGEGHGNPLQYSCLKNPMDRGAWWTIVHRISKEPTQLTRLSRQCPKSLQPPLDGVVLWFTIRKVCLVFTPVSRTELLKLGIS